ncbi:ROK family protein [Bacillus sp. T33-2]|uniref:ROK family protein n=1 Tax=Bacillus sp. T33-2 TaxID=2054168 RepID=UPI0015E0DBC5|nr:ROK family protein [Bacillus sp. T33-2]
MKAIGIDIGGTGVKGGIIGSDGVMLRREAVKTNVLNNREGVLESLFSVIDSLLEKEEDIVGIGVGTAGRVKTDTGEVVYATANLPGWQGTRVGQLLTERYQLPSFIENDANAALIGEAWKGRERKFVSVTMLTLGTGVGGANMLGGKVVTGGHYQSGEWGHVVLVPDGRPCNCGMKGCIEQYLSGSALVKSANEGTSINFSHGKDIFRAFSDGIEEIKKVVDTYLDHLALAIYNISVSVDPEAVIIGGGVIDSKEYWWDFLLKKLDKYNVPTKILPAKLGNEAGMFGAAKLVFDGVKKRGKCQ